MKLWLKVLLISVAGFGLGFLAFYKLMPEKGVAGSSSQKDGNAPTAEVSWSILAGLDINTGKPDDAVKKINGEKVKVPGFMVPLEDNESSIGEFLLVPNPQACIHVPAPPANQMIHVKMAPGKRAKMSWAPIWIHGRIQISEVNGPYGKSAYSLVGELTEPMK